MSGHDVRVLQDFLTRAGYSTPIVGTFGPQTEANVQRFERHYHLRANGVVNSQFVSKIRAIVANRDGTAVVADSTGGVSFAPAPLTSHSTKPAATTPGGRGKVVGGLAVAPAGAPPAIKAVIAAANKIAFKPYIYGGGHGSWNDRGYDCSGSVSYALHGGGLLSQTEDSGQLESYGSKGAGRWITIWANSGHVYMYVAGLRFDTGAQSSTGGSRWTAAAQSNAGYVERHPTDY